MASLTSLLYFLFRKVENMNGKSSSQINSSSNRTLLSLFMVAKAVVALNVSLCFAIDYVSRPQLLNKHDNKERSRGFLEKSDKGVIRTPDLQLRRLSFFPAELLCRFCGRGGTRTPDAMIAPPYNHPL